MTYIKKGYGYHIGVNFARAVKNIPIVLSNEYAKPLHVIGYIDAVSDSNLGYLRIGDKNGKIRVHIQKNGLTL